MKRSSSKSGFTLLEILVVVAIIGILMAIVIGSLNEGSAKSRDAERLSDMRSLESALELYKLRNGRYPEGCNGPNNWSGQIGTNFACSSGSQYISGLAPAFIPALPVDPKLDGVDSGYVYTVDEDGAVYKFMALNTVEAEEVSLDSEFARCGNPNNTSDECAATPLSPRDNIAYNSGPRINSCTNLTSVTNDYAVSAGYARGGTNLGSYLTTETAREYFTDHVRCK